MARKNLPALPTDARALAAVRRLIAVGARPEAVFVRVVPRRERRRDFARRFRFRGVDEMRRQQQGDGPPPTPRPRLLDTMI
ncbi:MAG: hypothetical protein WCK05_00440 [Planctomycetota bacterium]